MFSVLQTIAEAVLASIYVLVLFIIVTSEVKVFRNPFYSMFVATGVADVISLSICCLLRNYYGNVALDPQFKPLLLVAAVAAGSSFVAHMLGNMLIAVNRYSALSLKEKYEKVWNRRNVRIIIGLQYGCAIAVFIPQLGAEYTYLRKDDGAYLFVGVDRLSVLINGATYTATCLLYAVVSVTLNVRSLVLLHGLLKASEFARRFHNERGMLFYTTIVFLFTMLMCTQQVLREVATVTESEAFHSWITMQFYWLNDVMVSIPPFSLLMFNKELRGDIRNFFQCRRNQRSAVAFASSENRTAATGFKKFFTITIIPVRRAIIRSTY